MEFFGTLFLAIAVSFVPLNAVAAGVMLMSMYYIGGHISGGHYNPAVSIGAWLQDMLRTDDLFFYITAQTVGACVALWLFKMTQNTPFMPELPQTSLWMGVFMEALLTLVWVMVFLTVTGVGKFKSSVAAGVAIGFSLIAILSIAAGLFNPAIAISSGICSVVSGGQFPSTDAILIFLVGPVIGGVAASYIFQYFNPD
jgi:aquaporin Z